MGDLYVCGCVRMQEQNKKEGRAGKYEEVKEAEQDRNDEAKQWK